MSSKYFSDPHKRVIDVGDKLEVALNYGTVEYLPLTTSAMVEVGKAEHRSDRVRAIGEDDYSHAFEKLMHGLDTFVQEYWHFSGRGKRTPGMKGVLKLDDDDQFSLLLFWRLRHCLTHTGYTINSEIKKKYEECFRMGSERGLKPVIDLPRELVIGEMFRLPFEDYKEVRECFFRFVARLIPEKDAIILKSRASVINHEPSVRKTVTFDVNGFQVEIDEEDMKKVGIEWNNGSLSCGDKARVDLGRKCIYFLDTAECVPVRLIPVSPIDHPMTSKRKGRIKGVDKMR